MTPDDESIGYAGKPRQEWAEALKNLLLMTGTLCLQPNDDTTFCNRMFAPLTSCRMAGIAASLSLCHRTSRGRMTS